VAPDQPTRPLQRNLRSNRLGSRPLKLSALDAASGTCFTLGMVAVGVAMRGTDGATGSLFGHVDLEERVPTRHPLRLIRRIVGDALASLDAGFDVRYNDFGPSIAPERLIRAGLLQIRSERHLMEQMDCTLLVPKRPVRLRCRRQGSVG
jgi:hypothetical protein